MFCFKWTGALYVQVTSKGVGLNPNAKVWQEMPAAPSEAPVDGTEASPWSQSNVTEGNYLKDLLVVCPEISI